MKRFEGREIRVAECTTRQELDELVNAFTMKRLADSTQVTYSAGWRWWEIFCRRRGITPWRHVTTENMQEEQKLFMDFLVHLYVNGRKAPGTCKLYLSAVRARITGAGLPNPTRDMLWLWAVYEGMKRVRGASIRKKAVSVLMLRKIKARLQPHKSHDDAMLWFAILVAFYVLLRSPEYTSSDGSARVKDRGLRGLYVVPQAQGERQQSFVGSDELVLTIRGSKTDQLNRGEVRNHFRLPDPELCVIAAAEAFERHAPQHFKGSGESEMLCKWANGRPLKT